MEMWLVRLPGSAILRVYAYFDMKVYHPFLYYAFNNIVMIKIVCPIKIDQKLDKDGIL